MRFQDKVAVITGCAKGIGRATARIMAAEGAYVMAVDMSGPDLAALAEEIEAAGGKITTMEVDVLDPRQVERMVQSIVARFGRINILVNGVGGNTTLKRVDELTMEEWDGVVQFNIRGTFLCTRAAVRQMKKQGGGKIVNLSSRAGHGLSPSGSAYALAKAGIMAFTKNVAREAGPHGITRNAIAPGVTLSDRVMRMWEPKSEEDKQSVIEAIPLRRLAQPEDQAKVIAFLASEDADYVTGATIDVSGGLS